MRSGKKVLHLRDLMKESTDDNQEQAMVKLYMDLTGSTESGARSVFMYTCDRDGTECWVSSEKEAPATETSSGPTSRATQKSRTSAGLVFALACVMMAFQQACAKPSISATNSYFTHPLSLADAINIALHQNPNVLRAQRDVESAEGVAVQTKAIVIPKIQATGSYSAVAESDVDIVEFPPQPGQPGGTFGTSQNWSSQIRLVQSLYEGGRIMSSLRAARLTREQSMLNYQTVVADAVRDVELAYYDVLLAEQQIRVEEASVELLQNELTDTTRRFDAGTVPRFNVLRAEVELANQRPRLIQARSNYRVGKATLGTLLGFNEPKGTTDDVPLTLSGKLEAMPFQLNLQQALAAALEERSELGALRKAEALRQEDIISAKSGYKPTVQAYGGYDGHNTQLSMDLGDVDHGWITGVQVSWNIFDGFATKGRVMQATAQHERAIVDLDDATRRIELEVRTAWSDFIKADETLKSQEKVVEEAEEALRLASARSEAGTGTQLDVLSAQTALTQARTTQIQALHDYAASRARLERAVGINVPRPAGSHQ
jgi:outer membrane protein TolC